MLVGKEVSSLIEPELDEIFATNRLAKMQRQLLKFHFRDLKETYFLKGEKEFNQRFKGTTGLGIAYRKGFIKFV
tara:strand:- start:1987 stop:2208 length:222 start_codon:yes stop_codon:yes gene_type:complete